MRPADGGLIGRFLDLTQVRDGGSASRWAPPIVELVEKGRKGPMSPVGQAGPSPDSDREEGPPP